jgi:hypothetical protein
MLRRPRLYEFVSAAVIAGLLFPMAGYAEVQVFPPQLAPMSPSGSPNPADTTCPPAPPGETYNLVWDGSHNVWCSAVPLNCASGQTIQFDGSNFKCATPCSGNSETVFFPTPGAACPTGQTGGIGYNEYADCTGNVVSTPVNTCADPPPPAIWIGVTSTGPCDIGTVSGGVIDSSGNLNSQVCDANPASCSTYVCTATGWAPAP